MSKPARVNAGPPDTLRAAPPWLLRGALIAALLLLPLPLDAEVRSSASYSVQAETLDGGGGSSSSATYSNEGSFEPLVTGESDSSGYTILHGFITGMTAAILNDYDPWAQARGLTAGVNAGFFDDPNHDGRPNLYHFAFDTDPLGNGSDEGKRQIGSVEIGGLDYLTLTLPIRTGAVFSGNPLLSNNLDGLVYEILGDTDLDDPWILPVVELVPPLEDGLPPLGDFNPAFGGDWQYRSFRLTDPLGASMRYFLKAGAAIVP